MASYDHYICKWLYMIITFTSYHSHASDSDDDWFYIPLGSVTGWWFQPPAKY